MSDDETRMKTLWTQTLFDDLYSALKKGKSDTEIKQLLADLKDKEMPPAYLVKKVFEAVNPASAKRVEALLAGRSTVAGGKAGAPKKASGGLLASIKALFK